MSQDTDIRITASGSDWAQAAAELLRVTSDTLVHSNGRCLVALSGGSTPKTLYDTLTTPEWKPRLQWEHMLFLFGDERCVPPEHAESNFAMAQKALFIPLNIAPHQVYRMKGEAEDPVSAARDYEATLRQLTHSSPPMALPHIDLILLGLGDDGHTASLFPGSPALAETSKAVTVSHSPKGVAARLTLTLGVINGATVVVFLVTGSSKAPMVRAILEPHDTAERSLPAALVAPTSGQLIWMLDQAAASQLSGRH